MSVFNNHSDHDLIALLKENNQQAMTAIFARYWDKLLAIALNRLQNLEEAEECVQDVFLRLWKLRDKLELKYTLYTYLAAATRYRVLDTLDTQYRKQIMTQTLEGQEELHAGTSLADAELLERELIAKIEASIQQLPEKCRIVYRMSREDGLTHKNIAAELNISEKTVEAHLTKALKGLRDDLQTSSPALILIVLGEVYHHL